MLLQMERADRPDVHTLHAGKRQFCTEVTSFHLGTEFIFGNFQPLVQCSAKVPLTGKCPAVCTFTYSLFLAMAHFGETTQNDPML